MKQKLVEMYLDYVNNFLTVECFSEYYEISLETGYRVIVIGRKINNKKAELRNLIGPLTVEQLINL
jgi:hypothetical protein